MDNRLLIPSVGAPRAIEAPAGRAAAEGPPQAGEFDGILRSRLQEAPIAAPAVAPPPLKFSNHALDRIRDRGIRMDAAEQARLAQAVDTAAAKGAKETLVLTKDAAFIVSVPNKTVITALERGALGGNVFTNIDSTVLI